MTAKSPIPAPQVPPLPLPLPIPEPSAGLQPSAFSLGTAKMTSWWDDPFRLALAYAAQRLYTIATENRHLSWRQVAEKVGLPAHQTRTSKQLRVHTHRGTSSRWFEYQKMAFSSGDIAYVVRMYCVWWGGRYPTRVRRLLSLETPCGSRS